MAFSTLFDLHERDLTSEAEVETRLLALLFNDLGYPPKSVVPKKHLEPLIAHSGSKKFPVECDFLLFGSTGTARAVVEAKGPDESIQDFWGQAASYALSYNRDKDEPSKVKWLLISNGHLTSLYRPDSGTPVVTLELDDFASGSPAYVALRSRIKYMTTDEVGGGGLLFEPTSPDKLNDLFAECHNLIRKKEKMGPTDAFYEFCKFIFLKIREDKRREDLAKSLKPYQIPMTLEWVDAQRATSGHPVRDILFAQLRDDLEAAISEEGKKRIYEHNETLKLGADTSRELIKRFEHINLSSIDEDLNGRMFEVFLNAAVRGRELGQYFTPRPLVDFMTRISLYGNKDVEDPPKVIDGCCGTAGFLIEVMAYLASGLRSDTRFNARQRKRLEEKIKNEFLFGIEASERISRIARINMYLHGDGGSHIFHGDGLDNEPTITEDMSSERKHEVRDHIDKIKPSEFDIVLTNPPFSMEYKAANEEEERILRQLPVANGVGSVKSNILFLQRYYDLLKPGGEMLIVLDDTVLNGSTQIKVRHWLLEKFVILSVHSMPFNTFFKADANVKTSVIHVRKKTDEGDVQGHVFMSVSNNIGHDNLLKDTPERNNLNDILNAYIEWKRTGTPPHIVKENQDHLEPLSCPEQVWLLEPDRLSVERLDAFFYAPDLMQTWSDIARMEEDGLIEAKPGSAFDVIGKLPKSERRELKASGARFKYIEIGDVTRYGLITNYREGVLDELPTRAEYQVQKGDVLMALNNSSRGTVVMVPEGFDGGLCTSGFMVIRPRSEEEGHLLWYSLRSEYCRKQIYYLAQSAVQPELKREAWNEYFRVPIPLGPMKEKAVRESKEFQSHLGALLDADRFRLSSL